MASKPTRKELDAQARAQDVVYPAWEESSPKRGLSVARKALEISSLRADGASLPNMLPRDRRRLGCALFVDGGDSDAVPSFDDLALELRKLTASRKQTPSELLLREGRDER